MSAYQTLAVASAQALDQLAVCPAGRVVGVAFPGRVDQVGQARRYVRQALSALPGVDESTVGDAATCVSELATNAVTHTRSGDPGGTFMLLIGVRDGYAVVGVADQGRADGARPELRLGDGHSEHGHQVTAKFALTGTDGGERR